MNLNLKNKLLLSAVLSLAVATTASASDPYRRHRYNQFKGLATNTESIVFVGNSITDMGNWPEVFGNAANVVSRGVSGGFSWEVRDNVYNWIMGHPAKVFIKIGTNDLNRTEGSPEGIAENIDKTLAICLAESPDTKVYIQSIIPCNNGNRDDAHIRRSNELLQAVCEKYTNAEYFDLYQYMGGVATGWPLGCEDCLHLTGAGYATWAHAIEEKVGLETVYPSGADAAIIQQNYGQTKVDGGRTANFSIEPTKSGDVIFIGDGLVQSGEWHELLKGAAVVKNHGTGWEVDACNNTVTNNIIDATLKANGSITREMPKAILLYANSSNFNAATYEGFVTKINNYSTGIDVYCLNYQPKAGSYSAANNEAIRTICNKYNNVHYIDIASALAPHVNEADYFTEGLPYYMSYVTIAQQIASQAPELGLTAITTAEAKRNYAVANAAELLYSVKVGDNIGEYPAEAVEAVRTALVNLQQATGEAAIGTATTNLDNAISGLNSKYNSFPEHGKVYTVYNDHVGTPYFLNDQITSNCTALTTNRTGDKSQEWIVWGNATSGYEFVNVKTPSRKLTAHNSVTTFDITNKHVKVGNSLKMHGSEEHKAGNSAILSLSGGKFTGAEARYNEFTNANGKYSTDFVFIPTDENAYKVQGGSVTVAGKSYTNGQFVVTSGTLSASDVSAGEGHTVSISDNTIVVSGGTDVVYNIAQSAGTFQNTAAPSGYKDQWTSTQSNPVIKLNAVDGAGAAANNMFPDNNYADGIVCYSGNNRVASKPYCTDLIISVPDGYVITACAFDAKSYENDSNLLVTAGDKRITTSSAAQHVSVTGIDAESFRITIDGRTGNLNKAVAFTGFSITYKQVAEPVDPLSAYITPGKYYYIYNDNDSPLYLFSGSSALGVNASSQKDPAFMWKCIKNGDYYNFQNAATGLYLAHKGQQKNAYNFKIDPTRANTEGCLPLYSVAAERYFVLKYTGAFDQGTGTFNKNTTDFSTDFVFEETDPMALFFSPTLADATWVRITNKRSSDYVLTTKDGDAAGTMLHSATADSGDSHQLFALVGTAAGGFYIYNKEMGALTLTADNTSNGTPVKWTEGTPTKWFLRTDHFDAKGGYMLTTSTTAGTSMNMHGGKGNDIKFYDAPDGEGGSLWTISLVDDTPTIINYVVRGEKKYADANQWLGRLNITKGSFSSSTLVRADVDGTTFKAYLPKSDGAISITNAPLHGWLCDVAETDGVYTVTYTADQRTERQYLGFEPNTQLYRIPAIVRAQNDDLVAIYDYRVCHNDVGFGEVDQVMRRSTDNGKTWSAEEKIADGKGGGKVFGAAFGDPALVADADSPMMTLITVSGTTVYIYATATDHNLVSVQHSYDNGKTWTEPKEITDQFWGKAGGILANGDTEAGSTVFAYSGFFGSGKLMQSRHIKVGEYRRIYGAMLCRGKGVKGAYVVYSDDMGDTWKLLGGDNTFQAAPGSDEPKVEELPNGDVVLSCRKGGGRIFNVWRWSKMPSESDPLGQGTWGSPVDSNNSTTCPGGISVGGNSCNGEILLVDAVKADGTPAKLMLQSLPSGNDRTDVEIWYKDVTAPSAYSTNAIFGSNWTRGLRVSNTLSAYSTMCMQADGRIGFFYEEGPATYCMVYVPLLLSEITDGAYEGPQGWTVMPLTRTIEQAQQGKADLNRVGKVRDLILEK